MAAHVIATDIEIDASPARVWQALTDFARYPEWNPLVRSVAGTLREGARLRICVQAPGRRPMRFRPLVLVCEPERELRWRGRLLVPGLFDGEHYFRIHERPGNRVRVEHGEEFRGLLVGPLTRSLDRDLRRGFEAMNAALRARVEGRPAGGGARDEGGRRPTAVG